MSTSTTTATTKTTGASIVKAHDITKIGVKQFFDEDSFTYTYLLYDPMTLDAVIVDPVDIQVERDLKEMEPYRVHYGINTHAHADHITGTGLLKANLNTNENDDGTTTPKFQSVISKASEAMADLYLEDGDRIVFGNHYVTARATPGHTAGCMSYIADDASFVLTGDTLLIGGCGRTDFQAGNAEQMYDMVHSKLFILPDHCLVYPAHDYKGQTSSTIGTEKKTNPRLTKSKDAFVDLMNNLNLPYPKHIDRAVPANMKCGVQD